MTELIWFDYVCGKFYSSGRIYYNADNGLFSDVTDLNLYHVPAYFCANSLLNQTSVCRYMPDQLPMEFEMALNKLTSSNRNFLLQKFDQALTTLQQLAPDVESKSALQARVIVSRKGTVAEYSSDKKMFVYIISDEAEDQFYFAQTVRQRDVNDNRLYIYFVFEGDLFDKQ